MRRALRRPTRQCPVLRDVSVGLSRVGDVRRKTEKTDAALAAYTESLEIARELARMDPGNAQAQRDVSVGLNKVGDMELDAKDREAARTAYTESLDIARKLAARDPGNAQAQTDLVVSLTRVADLTENPAPRYLERLDILQQLDGEGRLSVDAEGWIELDERQARRARGQSRRTRQTATAK